MKHVARVGLHRNLALQCAAIAAWRAAVQAQKLSSGSHEVLTQLVNVQVVQSTAASFGCTAEVDFHQEDHPYYPPTVNDASAHAFAMDVASR